MALRVALQLVGSTLHEWGPARFFSLFVFIVSSPAGHSAPVLAETLEKDYSIDPGSKITIRNIDGSVWVYGAPIDQMKVEAVKKAYKSQRLDEISVNVSINGSDVLVDTQYPSRPKWGLGDRSGTVDYVIVIPWTCRELQVELVNGEVWLDEMRCGLTRVSLGNGRLFVHDCFTDLRATVGKGGFEASWEWWENQKFAVTAEMGNGNMRAYVPLGAGFHLFASSASGKVTTESLSLGQTAQQSENKIDARIGDASGMEMILKATDGNVIISGANQ